MIDIFDRISQKIKDEPSQYQAYEDFYFLANNEITAGNLSVVQWQKWLSNQFESVIPTVQDTGLIREMFMLHKRSLLSIAQHDFESFIQYTEWEREPQRRFYMPRRKALQPLTQSMQDLADDVLDILCISLPPGVGKTTLAIFFLTWLAGKYPDEPILTGSHSNSFIRGVYDECLRILDPQGEYLWRDVFPNLNVVSTNAKDCRIDLHTNKRFDTLEFTTVGSGNAGLYRAKTLLYCDDLISGIELALSKDRLDKLWELYTTDLRQRKIGNKCKELHIATRWSVHDVIGRLEQMYGESDRARFVTIPAMNADDESNFDYPYGVGFSTDFYKQQRLIMDDASWRALYMNEPIEREGLLYADYELRRYFELPTGDPDAIIGICDTKDKGKDYCFLPVVYVYGQNYYVEDCLCDNGLPTVVDVRIADILTAHKVQACRFESNSAGGRIAEKIAGQLKEKGVKTHITTKFTGENKETKIIVNSDWVKKHCLFKDESCYTLKSDYGRMMKMLMQYTVVGKNKYDDVPDGMAMLAIFADSLNGAKVEVFQRPW